MRLQFKPANEHALKITNGAQIIFFYSLVLVKHHIDGSFSANLGSKLTALHN